MNWLKNITKESITARCVSDSDGCLIWQGATIKGHPYWATRDTSGRRVNVNVAHAMVKLSGVHVSRGCHIKRACSKALCVNPDCMHAPIAGGMFSQLLKKGFPCKST